MVKYAYKNDNEKIGKAKEDDAQVSYKRTYAVLRAIKGMKVQRAQQYLDDVLYHKDIIPIYKFQKGSAHNKLAHKWGVSAGRFPTKSTQKVQILLKQATQNYMKQYGVQNEENIYVKDVFCGLSGRLRHRRNYRAHGSVNRYNSEPCHIQIIVGEKQEPVQKGIQE